MRNTTLLLMLSLITSIQAQALTIKEAYELLQKSDKWNLTETISSEGSVKREEEEAEFKPKYALYARQFAMHTNPIQYGLNNTTQTIDTIGYGSTGVETNWTFFDPLKKAALLAARSKEKLSQDQVQQYKIELTAGMLFQYLNLQKLLKNYELSQNSLNRSELIYKLAAAKRKVGAGIPLDVARAKNLVNLDKIKKMSTYNKLLKAKHDLIYLLGIDDLPSEVQDLKFKNMNLIAYNDYLHEAIETRPDLKSSRDALNSANEAMSEISGKFFPKLAMVGEVGSSDTTLLGLPGKNVTGFIGVSLTIPINTGGWLDSKRTETRILKRRAELNFKDKMRDTTNQVKEALENLALAKEAISAAQEYLDTSKQEEDISKKKYIAGSGNALEYATAHSNLSNAEDSYIEAMFNYEAAKIALCKATGEFKNYFSEME